MTTPVADRKGINLYRWKGANYDFGLHVQVDVSRGSGSIIAFERMFALEIAEGVETGWLGGYRRLDERKGVKGLI